MMPLLAERRSSPLLALLIALQFMTLTPVRADRPNVLVAISDDQSYPHASAYGQPVIETPAFDRVARRGVLFRNAFTPCPGCSPMRAAFLTGQHVWQLAEAGTHASSFPRHLQCYTGRLADEGYHVGYTGKPWSPGNFRVSGWEQNPVGPAFNSLKNESPAGIANIDYAANFESFLDQTASDQPFCFWYGGQEPHRAFGKGLGAAAGMDAADVDVPKFLPDSLEVRNDLLDYFYEIQWFDQHLGRMLETLEARGMLDNTLVIVTSDNGMAFPRAKANLYEYGIHMPLAISWPAGGVQQAHTSDALVSLIDVTATIYDACEVAPPESQPLSGRSLSSQLRGTGDVESVAVFAGRERHSSSRFNTLGYPCRCVRTADFLYIHNFTPQRWPAGAPQKYDEVTYDDQQQPVDFVLGDEHGGYHDIDGCPTLDWMIAHRDESEVGRLLDLAVGLRPAEELYAIDGDAACLRNLASLPEYADKLEQHRQLLAAELERTDDLRQTDFAQSHVWEMYPRYSPLRWFPEPLWARTANGRIPQQEWLEQRRPKKGE